jgi:Cd2+/Zn2+-exporting ATPase
LDGEIIEGNSFVDTSALTGESVPRKVKEKDIVLAGMINQAGLLTIRVTKLFSESSISRILELVENAASKKAETEKFITTFAKYYTPVVVFGALLLAVIPPLFFAGQTFTDWIYRALVVLVISCPCALVISIPLGYFGGIGGASRKGILVKGSNYLDALTKIKTVVFDKTGTLTKGEFKVAEIISANGFKEEEILKYAAYAEANSNHPIAKSILDTYDTKIQQDEISEVNEISGKGIQARVNDNEILVGNDKLLHQQNIEHDKCDVEGTVVHVAVNRKYAGYIVISDSLKEEAIETINELNKLKIKTVMLTGDNESAAEVYAKKLGIKVYYSGLLPENKVEHIERLIDSAKDGKVAFVGDGINDAPVIARADVGIAMGALGSDAAVETADVVLMADSPMQVVKSIEVAKRTRRIVWQNITFAMGVKLFFILLGAFGVATMWEAVFGDMGVAIIAILNAMRVMR